MLVAAKNYEQELQSLARTTWYDEKYQYFWCGYYSDLNFHEDDFWHRDFAYIENGKVKGFFSYKMDRDARSITSFGLLSFFGPSVAFMNEVMKHIKWLFDAGIVDRMEFFAFESNPVMRSYQRMVKRFGGKPVGKLTRAMRLYDGKLHNSIIFEILREDYEEAMKRRKA